MGACFREVRQLVGGGLSIDRILAAGAMCRFRVIEASDTYVRFRSRCSFWSIGERVNIRLSVLDADQIVEVESLCVMRSQLLDYGKNRQNVRQVLALLAEMRPEATLRPVTICPRCEYLMVGLPSGTCPECGESPSGRGLSPISQLVPVGLLRYLVLLIVVEWGIIEGLWCLGLGRFLRVPTAPVPLAICLLKFNGAITLGLLLFHFVARCVRSRRGD